jgi:hypothetical protein
VLPTLKASEPIISRRIPMNISKHLCATRVWPLFLVFSLLLPIGPKGSEAKPVDDHQAKHVKVFLEGDTSDILKFIKLAEEKAPDRNLSFEFTRDKESDWDVRVVLSAEGSSMWSYAHGTIVVMDNKSDVLFTVNRSDRLTGKGATSALTKEVVKMLARYYGVSK